MNEKQLKTFFDAVRPTLGALTIANVDGFKRVIAEAERSYRRSLSG